MYWFRHERDLRHERVQYQQKVIILKKDKKPLSLTFLDTFPEIFREKRISPENPPPPLDAIL